MIQKPLTLREISGLPSTPAPLSESVLIIVDAQKEYTEGSLKLEGIEESIDALSKFLERARLIGIPIIHVIQVSKPGGKIMAPETRFSEIIDKVKPIEGELIIKKQLPSSFKGTELETKLNEIGKKDLIITGYMTHMCLNSTTRDAAELGFRCSVIAELTATRDLPGINEGCIPAEIIKSANLAALADRFATVLEKSADIK